MSEKLDKALETFERAQKAPREQYLRAAICYYRLAADEAEERTQEKLDLTVKRLECEEEFRALVNRSFDLYQDFISLGDLES